MKAQAIPGVMRFQKVHGMTMTPVWRSWREMLARCQNPNNDRYADYGGRGISVCKRWQEFINFYADMGERPEGMSLDRKDNEGNYEPSNCKWSNRHEQQANSRQARICTINGVQYPTIGAAARALGVHRATMQWRINHGVYGGECVAKMQAAKEPR